MKICICIALLSLFVGNGFCNNLIAGNLLLINSKSAVVIQDVIPISDFKIKGIQNQLSILKDSLKREIAEKIKADQVEISIPCSDLGISDFGFFRADASAENSDPNESKINAMENVKKRMNMLIGIRMNVINERYINEIVDGVSDEYKLLLGNLVKEVTIQLLTNIKSTCEKTMKGYDRNLM